MANFDELKNKIRETYEKIWKHDNKMVDYCCSKVSGFVEFEDGGIFLFEKPTIKTSFCFGYGQNGISTEEEFNNATESSEASKSKVNFICNNLSRFFKEYEELLSSSNIYTIKSYNDEETVFRSLRSQEYFDFFQFEKSKIVSKLSKKDRENLKKEIEAQKQKFAKRLETYWKKYGNTKLKTWTYLVD